MPNLLGPCLTPRCPECGNSLQNGIPFGTTNTRLCATCKLVWELDYVGIAKEFATIAHQGQTRWGGDPYITHPAAVVEKVKHLGPKYEAVAWLHDVLEDTKYSFIHLGEVGIPEDVICSVNVLTKMEGESYLSYICVIATDKVATAIKLAGLEHNLSTSDPVRNKKIRDKWLLAKYILERE